MRDAAKARAEDRTTAMFHHVVLMELKDADARFLARVRDYETRIRRELPYVRSYHFGRNAAARAKAFAWVVVATFDSAADHDRYQVSPAHQEMKAFMTPHIADIVVCDFDGSAGDAHA